MNRKLTAILTGAALLLTLTACGEKPAEAPADSVQDTTEEPHQITLSATEFTNGDTITIMLSDLDVDYDRAPRVGILDTDEHFDRELDADEHDLWYFNLTEEEHTSFSVKIGEDVTLEPGSYQVIVTDTDNGSENGNVLDSVVFTVK